ncbi:DUF998 domain-containing protein [Microbacterium schleiferi]|uniref:DUF998 domain-containing protein n=1 Tax=Microbacterium schleiferi TaxID=69362 RepID=A0A7S8MW86_9MICO|nr:DUF998 domain-containing protein [Microbacterium schleiferi]QPE04439.1 DUF998 domain-containing protein [Microbacterium schleiferi]
MTETTPAPADTRRAHRLVAAESSGPAEERTLESLGLGVGTVAFVVIVLVALAVFRFEGAPISGPGSLGEFSAIASAVAGILAFAVGRYVMHRREGGPTPRVLDYLDVAALAFAHGIIALLSWTLLAVILEDAFIGAEVFALPLLALSGTAAAMTAYIVFYSATHMDLPLLAVVLAVFLAEGVLAAMLTASDPYWWKDNLSALGMTNDVSAMTFNLTLIVAGFIVTTLARYTTRGIPTSHAHGIRWVRLCLILVGVFLACVGLFPVNDFFWVHTGFASGMAVVFGVLVIRLPAWIPGIARPFVALGWLFIAVIVVLAVFFAVQYYTLTAVELVAGILVFSWIILFIRNAAALETDVRTS